MAGIFISDNHFLMIPRLLTRAAALIVFLALPGFAGTPALVVFPESVSFPQAVSSLEAGGAQVRQRVPPRLVIADFPSSRPNVAGAQVYTGPVIVASLEPLGPVAVAAGVHWNRQVLSHASVSGLGSAAMLQSLSGKSLPPPDGLTVSAKADRLHCEWSPVDAATFYEVQASRDIAFASVDTLTSVGGTSADLPLPAAPGTVYVRVRAMDLGKDGADDDVKGAWNGGIPVTVASVPSDGGPTALGTSPANDIETRGFTLVLEWTGADLARLQVSRTEDFSTTLFDGIVDGAEFACLQQAMTTGDRLFWRVRAEGPSRGPWSSARRVTIGAAHSEMSDAFVNPEAPR